MKLEKPEHLLICGDIHGQWKTLIQIIIQKGFKDKRGIVIIAGDCGIFSEKTQYWENINKVISQRIPGFQIICIRGNHDNPERFDSSEIWYSHLKAISDYEVLEIGDHRILPIGGAQSIDIGPRLFVNKKYELFGSHKRVWWDQERPEKDLNLLKHIGKIDIVVSHEAPINFGPILERADDMELSVYENIKEDREYLRTIYTELSPEYWFYGHYHTSMSGCTGSTKWRGLDVNEITEILLE